MAFSEWEQIVKFKKKFCTKKYYFTAETEKKTYFNSSRMGETGYNRKAEKSLKNIILSKSVISRRSSSILKIFNGKILENENHSNLYIIIYFILYNQSAARQVSQAW